MNIFNRGEKRQDYEDDDFPQRKIPSNKFKDLNPQNKKKRKEPVKPWGRQERLLVGIILLATVFVSAILMLSAGDWNLPSLPKVSLPSFNFLEGQTTVIEKRRN